MATQTMIASGDCTNSANISNPPFAPGDRIESAGFDVIIPAGTVLGDGSGLAVVGTNASDFDEMGSFTYQSGAQIVLNGGASHNNADVILNGADILVDTTGRPSEVPFGWGDNGSRAAGYELSANGALITATGSQPVFLDPGGGANFNLTGDGLVTNGFGDNDGAGNTTLTAMTYQCADSAQCKFVNEHLEFTNFKGRVDILLYGEGVMGDINSTGLYMVNPSASGGFTEDSDVLFVDLAVDKTVDYPTANARVFSGVRAHGSGRLRFPGGYNIDDMRWLGRPSYAPSDAKAPTSQNRQLTGDHKGSFVSMLGSCDYWYARDTAPNGHGIELGNNRVPGETTLRYYAWEAKNVLGTGADTADMLSTNAGDASANFITDNQTIIIEDWLQVYNSASSDTNTGSIVLTLNGELDPTQPGANVGFKPQIKLLQGTAVLCHGGRVINADEAGFSPSDVVIEERDNIYADLLDTAATSISLSFSGAPETNIVSPNGSNYNSRYRIEAHSLPMGTAFGANDIENVDPEFVEPDRNLEEWALRLGETEDQALLNLCSAGAINGADPTVWDLERLIQFLANGLVPLESQHQTASSTGGRIGGTLGVSPVVMTDVNGGADLEHTENASVTFAQDVSVLGVFTEDVHGNRAEQTITGQATADSVQFTVDKQATRLGVTRLIITYEPV